MPLWNGWREKQEKLRQEGRKQMDSRWIAWNARREEAERLKKPFTEPPPSEATAQADAGR